jgi:beta-N-acetylhexosaminidase
MNALEQMCARMVGIGFDGPDLTSDARALIAKGVRNVIFFTRNVQSPTQFAALTSSVKSAAGDQPLMTCVDQEGGRVLRLQEPFTSIPSMRQVGRAGDEQLARAIGRVLARELRAVNIDMNLAPVLDVDTNSSNPVISSRSFGAQSEVVARLGAAVIRGLQETGVGACAKHFPGHGDTSKDSHQELPTLLHHDLERLCEIELPPFESAIDAGVASIMTSHVIYSGIDPVYPATLSQKVIDDILRKRLGYNGLVMSDDMQMKAIADHFGFEDSIVRGASAGVDLFWICHSVDLQNRAIESLVHAVERHALPLERIEEANARLDRVVRDYVKPGAPEPLMKAIGAAEHRAVACQITQLAGQTVPVGEDPTEAFARTQVMNG